MHLDARSEGTRFSRYSITLSIGVFSQEVKGNFKVNPKLEW